MAAAPVVFISYSHDSPEHKAWVERLAERLMASGVDTILDVWDLSPGEDVPAFMNKHVLDCDKVLLVCTSRYVDRTKAGVGGAGYESMIVSSELMASTGTARFIPLIRQEGTLMVPFGLGTKRHVDFSNDDEFEGALDDLLRGILGSTIRKKPPLGNIDETRTRLSKEPVPAPQLVGHALRILEFMVNGYDGNGECEVSNDEIAKGTGLGFIAVSRGLTVLLKRGLIGGSGDERQVYYLRGEGLAFAEEKGLVSMEPEE